MRQLRVLFKTFLENHPIVGNALVYGTLCVAAETSQQVLCKKVLEKPRKPIDTAAIGRYVVYGVGLGGPLIATWYTFLDKLFPSATFKVVVKKMWLDQLGFTPLLLTVFYISMSYLEGKEDIFAECRDKFRQTYVANCMLWIPAQAINFSMVPHVFRVTYIGICSFAWINVLCWYKRLEISKKI